VLHVSVHSTLPCFHRLQAWPAEQYEIPNLLLPGVCSGYIFCSAFSSKFTPKLYNQTCMEHLPDNLDEALRAIADKSDTPLSPMDIKKLLAISYITERFGGGWMVNSKGREYLKKVKK
jgi:hypothetical protein